jgi:4-hydroxy-3-polyprenylbenzoate decarboxylase
MSTSNRSLDQEQSASATSLNRTYPDLHDHIECLKKAGLLIVVDRPINKDTEMHPLVRWQYCGGIPIEERKAFLFTNVIDSKGRSYDIPVLVGGLGTNSAIYSIGMRCEVDKIRGRLARAMNEPISPHLIGDAPCQEIIYSGSDLLRGHGLDHIPVPISTPGWDNAPYTSTSHFITKDPETGIQNMGLYRGQIKAPDRMGINTSIELRTGGYMHWEKYKTRGEPMPCAVVLGCPPVVTYVSKQKVPENIDELHVAGGVLGTPLNVVKAKTVDLLVPAEAEIVIEGFVSTEFLEPEAPFGESHGHVNLQEYNGYLEVTAITRRHKPVITSWMSQLTPSESTATRVPSIEEAHLGHLRNNLGIKGVRSVTAHAVLTGMQKVLVIQFERNTPQSEVWRALYGAASFRRAEGKWIIAVDTDIDGRSGDAILWALAFRCKPHRDLHILRHKDEGHSPRSKSDSEDSSVLVNAVLRESFSPIAMPKKQFMERAREIWEELGLPRLTPIMPWYGYDLGEWNENLEHQAQLAVRGDYWETGKWAAERRRSDLGMNTEVRSLDLSPDFYPFLGPNEKR